MTFMDDYNKALNEQQVTQVGDMTIYTLGGKVHREDGPAVITSWSQEWYINGIPHRDNGAARVYKEHPVSGDQFVCEWWINGKYSAQNQDDENVFNLHWHKGNK